MSLVLALVALALGVLGGLLIVAGQVALLVRAITHHAATTRLNTSSLIATLLNTSKEQATALDRIADKQKYIVLTVDGLAVAAIVNHDDFKAVKH